MEWIDLAKHKNTWRDTANTKMNLRIPQNSGNLLTSSGNISFSKRTFLHGLLENTFWGQRTYSCLCRHDVHSFFSLDSDQHETRYVTLWEGIEIFLAYNLSIRPLLLCGVPEHFAVATLFVVGGGFNL